MRDTFIKKLSEAAQKNSRIFLIAGDLGFGIVDSFEKKYPRQFLNAGVAEQNMTGLAAGLALEGKIIFTYSIANFPILRCLEQIRNDICYHRANVKIVSIGGGFSYGSLGFSHHATEDLAIMRALPEMTVLSPGDLWEVEGATEALIQQTGPAYLRLDKSSAGPTQKKGETFQFGKIRTLREGSDLTLMTTGGILGVVLAAAERLAQAGIETRVFSIHTLKPLDEDTILKAAQETGGIITIEEHSILGGLGGAVSELLLESGIFPQLFYRMGLRDQFSTIVGSQSYLRKRYHLDEEAIIEKTKALLMKSKTVSIRKAVRKI